VEVHYERLRHDHRHPVKECLLGNRLELRDHRGLRSHKVCRVDPEEGGLDFDGVARKGIPWHMARGYTDTWYSRAICVTVLRVLV